MEHASSNGRAIRALDWLDARPWWQFLLILYLVRWLIIVPFMLLDPVLFSGSQLEEASLKPAPSVGGVALLIGLLVSAPLLETTVECAIPYAIFARIKKYRERRVTRPWGFILTSALLMMLLHPIAAALVPAFTTGFFLGYTYAHFAPTSTIGAFAATYGYHAAINVVGYVMLATM